MRSVCSLMFDSHFLRAASALLRASFAPASTVLAASTALITASTASAQESGGWDFEGVPSWSIPDSIAAGELTNLTFGVNWYLEDHVRVMANLVDGTLSVPGAADTDVSGAQLRLQWDF